jgi:predicted transcriptional regulator
MNANLEFDQLTVKNSLKILSILSKKDNLAIFINTANEMGLIADLSTPEHLGLCKKTYYARLKQLKAAGLLRKSEGVYIQTTLGKMIYQKYLELVDQLKNIKHFKMLDALKSSKEFSDEDIQSFIGKLISENSYYTKNLDINAHIEVFRKYEEMVSTMIMKIETCKKELLVAANCINESLINSILDKVRSGVKIRVITNKSLANKFFDNNQQCKMNLKSDKTLEHIRSVRNASCAYNINFRITEIPFSMIILDSQEVGIEITHSNDPKSFDGVIFVRNENMVNLISEYYEKIWTSSSDDIPVLEAEALTRRYLVTSPG